MKVPPNPSPPEAPLRVCPTHAYPHGQCLTCLELEKSAGPRPPFAFYPSLRVDLSKRGRGGGSGVAAGSAKGATSGGSQGDMGTDGGGGKDQAGKGRDSDNPNPPKILTITPHCPVGVIYTCVPNPKQPFIVERRLGYVTAVLLDGRENGWIGVVPWLQFDQATAVMPGSVPRDFDRQYEVMFPDTAGQGTGTVTQSGPGLGSMRQPNRYFRWLPTSEVAGTFQVHFIEKAAFRSGLKSKAISRDSYFVRGHVDDAAYDDDD